MSGSGAEQGFDYQASAFAYLAAHVLSGHPLDCFGDTLDIPTAISVETGGPGDDFMVEMQSGRSLEIQAKHRLTKNKDFWECIGRLTAYLRKDDAGRVLILLDSCSSDPVRNQLREDIERIGNGRYDSLKEITLEVVRRVGLQDEHGIAEEASELCRRWRIRKVDLESGDDGYTAAAALLRPLLESPADVATVWRVLSDDAHKLAKRRGRIDLVQITQLVQRHAQFAPSSAAPATLLHRYLEWLAQVTDELSVPLLSVRVPVREVWNRVRVRESSSRTQTCAEALRQSVVAYSEWARLAERDSGDRGNAAEAVVTTNGRVVIIGGAGAGKSTLCQRLVHWAAKGGWLPLRARLKPVWQQMTVGKSFEDAIATSAAEGLGLNLSEAKALLENATLLVLDGLDECGSDRFDVAQKIHGWTEGHPRCHVCVTTRPAGHNLAFLPGFVNLDLLPLDREATSALARALIEHYYDGDQAATDSCNGFAARVAAYGSPSAAQSLAARNPLLLTFLVYLHLNEVSLDGNRADLIGKIIEVVIGASPPGHITRSAAMLGLAAAGFSVVDKPTDTTDQVLEKIAAKLSRSGLARSPEAADVARQVVEYWTSRQLLEELTAGHLSVLAFAHPAIGEYAAALFARDLARDELDGLMARTARVDEWREVILMAASAGRLQEIVQALVALDDPGDVTSTEACLAAAALAEATEFDECLVSLVTPHLVERLTSPIQLISIEAAAAAVELAALAPALIGPIGQQLIGHQQPWTNFAGVAITLAAGREFITTEQIRTWLREFDRPLASGHRLVLVVSYAWTSMDDGVGHDMTIKALGSAARRLLDDLPIEEAERELEAVLRVGHLTSGAHTELCGVLISRGLGDVVKRAEMDYPMRDSQRDYEKHFAASVRAHQALFHAVLAATGLDRHESQVLLDMQPVGIAALFDVLQPGKVPAREFLYLGHMDRQEELSEITRGTIAALDLDRAQLADEASMLLSMIDAEGDDLRVWRLLPEVQSDPDWTKSKDIGLRAEMLAAALCNPSHIISIPAAYLLAYGAGGDAAALMLQRILWTGEAEAIRLTSLLASSVWPEAATEMLLDRLAGPALRGREHLFSVLAELPKTPEQLDLLLDHIFCKWRRKREAVMAAA